MTEHDRTQFDAVARAGISPVMGSGVEELLLQAQDLGALLAWVEDARQLVVELGDLAQRDPEVQAKLQRDCPAHLCADWGAHESAGLQRVQMLVQTAVTAATERLCRASAAMPAAATPPTAQ